LAQLIGDLTMAGVIAYALKIVWGKYQEQITENKQLMKDQTQEWKRLAGLEESRDPEETD
ncbi:hypothetical protein LCGC14_2305050, partial [marine sediment metagenome]